jgi:hypothetical protein
VPLEAQLESVVGQALKPHSLSGARCVENINSSLLEDAGAKTVLDVCPATVFEHD